MSAGRDTCGTTGVGSYRIYRYGTRWFGGAFFRLGQGRRGDIVVTAVPA